LGKNFKVSNFINKPIQPLLVFVHSWIIPLHDYNNFSKCWTNFRLVVSELLFYVDCWFLKV